MQIICLLITAVLILAACIALHNYLVTVVRQYERS